MYYKDKKLVNFFKMELSFILMKSYYRRVFLCLASLFLVYYFYSLTAPSENHIITDDIIEQKPQSSLILDTIIKQDESIDELPIHTLVSPYKNGMFLYNMEEATESWWTFECIVTKMKNIINTQLCIHEPKYDHHISGQLKENGMWEPTNVRSFIKQLEEVPDANVIDIGANIGLYTLLAAKMKRYVIAVEPLHENLNRIHKASNIGLLIFTFYFLKVLFSYYIWAKVNHFRSNFIILYNLMSTTFFDPNDRILNLNLFQII